jgi:carbamoyltransferase
MTAAFKVREEHLNLMQGVISIDGTCRPHFVGLENSPYRELLLAVREKLGKGVILNTSFNIHGDPMVCSPDDALDTFSETDIKHLFLEDYLVEKTST